MKFKEEVLIRLDKLAEKQQEHTVLLAVNTKVVEEHHKRSLLLETEFKPVQRHVALVNSLIKIVLAIVTTTAAIASIYHYFLSK